LQPGVRGRSHRRTCDRMSAPEPVVFVVEDDAALRSLVRALVHSIGVNSRTFPSADKFLEHYDPRQPGCLVLDVFMPGMSGLELQDELNRRGAVIPVIFIRVWRPIASRGFASPGTCTIWARYAYPRKSSPSPPA
ncbi:MAG TPA: response regulator, partial [Steroidobacteraceae bacterium]|nr:response regulator [Steroidobacteraceae bacterium]